MNVRQDKERGAILLTTILVMSLMAVLAVAMFDDVRLAVKRTVNIQNYAQADWYAKGAQDFAQSYLSQQFLNVKSAEFNASLINPEPVVFPIEGGMITLSLRDGSQCIDINTLASGSGARQFRKLLIVLGWDALSAARLTAVTTDWTDVDEQILPDGAEDYSYLSLTPPYRTANTDMHSSAELRALQGVGIDTYKALHPFTCARPSEAGRVSVINVNTLTLEQAPVLAAILPEEGGYALAQSLILDRPAQGYESVEQLRSAPAMETIDTASIDFDSLVTTPRYIWVEADIAYKGARRIMGLEFDISGERPILITRRIGAQALRLDFRVKSRSQTQKQEGEQ